jgi:hypothetical protein
MVTASCVVSAFALVASLPVVWVLRKHWARFVCYACCHSPFRIQKPPRATESDIVLSILLMLQTADLWFAVGFLLSPLNHAGSYGATWVCPLQGVLLQFAGPSAMLFSACLSIELFIVIRGMMGGRRTGAILTRSLSLGRVRRPTITAPDQLGRWDTTVNARFRLTCYSVGTMTVSGSFVLLDLVFDGFGPLRSNSDAAGAWCWVKDAADKGNADAQFAFISYYGVAFVAILVVVFFYMLVLVKICRRVRETQHATSGSEGAKNLMRVLWKTVCRVGVYPIFLVVVLLPGTIHRLPSILNLDLPSTSPGMNILHAITMPLLGLIDALVLAAANTHVRKRIYRCVKCRPEIDEQEKTRWRSRSNAANQSLDTLDMALEAHDAVAGDARGGGGGVVQFGEDSGEKDAWRENGELALVETLRWSDEEDYDGPDYGSLEESAAQLNSNLLGGNQSLE